MGVLAGYVAVCYTPGMFIKLTRAGGRTYAQLVESFRDEGGRPRQRTLATLGRIDESGGQVDSLLTGLLRAKGRSLDDTSVPQVRFESALALGDVWALDQLWRELGFDGLAAVFRRARFSTPVEHALRVMVFNRLCDPDSKLGVLRWLQTVNLPGVDAAKLTHQQLLRSMDALAYFTPSRTPISRDRGQRFTARRTPFHADRGQRFSLMADSGSARG